MDNSARGKILVIEDDDFLRDFYNELLTSEGYLVETAGDGLTGMDKIKIGGWNLILLDIMLPKKDGLTVLRELHNLGRNFGPIIMLTNLGSDTAINQAFTLGATGYLIKSAMDPDQVLNEVKNFLQKKTN